MAEKSFYISLLGMIACVLIVAIVAVLTKPSDPFASQEPVLKSSEPFVEQPTVTEEQIYNTDMVFVFAFLVIIGIFMYHGAALAHRHKHR